MIRQPNSASQQATPRRFQDHMVVSESEDAFEIFCLVNPLISQMRTLRSREAK